MLLRRFFVTCLLLVATTSGVLPSFAQFEEPPTIATPDEVLTNTQVTDPSTGAAAAPAPRGWTGDREITTDAAKCTFTVSGGFSLIGCIDVFLGWTLKSTLIPAVAGIVFILGVLFEKGLSFAFAQFTLFSDGTLYPLWALSRNIVSVMGVFILLYVIFMYVIDREDKVQRYVPFLFIFAILVNFSYLIATSLIAGANSITGTIYGAIIPGGNLATPGANAPLVLQIFSALGLGSFQELILSANGTGTSIVGQINGIGTALVFLVLLAYLGYVLFSLTWMVIMTSLVFMASIIFAPLLLMNTFIPKLDTYVEKARTMFLSHLALGPVLLFMLYLNLSIIAVINKSGEMKALLQGGGADQVVLFFGMLFIIGMLHMTLKICQFLSGAVGQVVSNTVGNVMGAASWVNPMGLGLKAASRAGQLTLGRMAAKQAQSGALVGRLGGRGTLMGDAAHGVLKRMSNATYDLRALPGVSSVVKAAGGNDRLLGTKETGGYVTRVKEREDALRADVAEYQKDMKGDELREAIMRRTSKRLSLRGEDDIQASGAVRNIGVSEEAASKIRNEALLSGMKKLPLSEYTKQMNELANKSGEEEKEALEKAVKERAQQEFELVTKGLDPRSAEFKAAVDSLTKNLTFKDQEGLGKIAVVAVAEQAKNLEKKFSDKSANNPTFTTPASAIPSVIVRPVVTPADAATAAAGGDLSKLVSQPQQAA